MLTFLWHARDGVLGAGVPLWSYLHTPDLCRTVGALFLRRRSLVTSQLFDVHAVAPRGRCCMIFNVLRGGRTIAVSRAMCSVKSCRRSTSLYSRCPFPSRTTHRVARQCPVYFVQLASLSHARRSIAETIVTLRLPITWISRRRGVSPKVDNCAPFVADFNSAFRAPVYGVSIVLVWIILRFTADYKQAAPDENTVAAAAGLLCCCWWWWWRRCLQFDVDLLTW